MERTARRESANRFCGALGRILSRGALALALLAGASALAAAAPDRPVTTSPTSDPAFVAAAQRLQTQAEQGSAVAQYQLGIFYQGGIGVRRDVDQAVKWFRRSADQNFAPAINQLASMYEHGRGVPANKGEAIRLYQLSAARGDMIGQQNLARLTGAPPPRGTIAGVPPGQPSMAMAMMAPPPSPGTVYVPLRRMAGVLMVPAMLDESVAADFVVDSGAADVSVPETVVALLRKAGKLVDSDFIGSARMVLADGSKITSPIFVIRQLKVGDKTLLNVKASVAPGKAPPLLGQSFLQRFRSWSIDNSRQALVLGD